MSDFEFTIDDNIEIPKREAAFGPRGSKYPIDELEEGQSFAVHVEVSEAGVVNRKDGTTKHLTLAETTKRKAAQLQSMFSSLAKKRGITLLTRFIASGDPRGDNMLRVWRVATAPNTDSSTDPGTDEGFDL